MSSVRRWVLTQTELEAAVRTLKSLTYTAPFAAPLAYMGLGCLTLTNRMIFQQTREWSQRVLFFAMRGFAGNFVLSLADHASNGCFHRTEWIPVASSAAAVGFLLTLLVSDTPPGFRRLCTYVPLLQALVGALGFVLHFWADLHGPGGRLLDNLLSGAPPFAPLLLPNLSILAWIALHAQSEPSSAARSRHSRQRALSSCLQGRMI
jgi:hypothetical protein